MPVKEARGAKTDTRAQSADPAPTAAPPLDLTKLLKRETVQVATAGDGAAIEVVAAAAANPDQTAEFAGLATPGLSVGGAAVPISRIDVHVHRLKTLDQLLGVMGDGPVDTAALRKTRRALDQALENDLAATFAKQRPLEATYRTLDQFYQKATAPGRDADHVRVANASGAQLATSPALLKDLARQVPKFTEYSLVNLESIVLIPGWAGGVAALEKFGRLAEATKSVVFTDFKDCSLGELDSTYTGKGSIFDGLKGPEGWKSRVVVLANYLRVRGHNRHESDDLYIAPSAVFAGLVSRGDDAGVTATSVENKPLVIATADGSDLAPRWELTDRAEDHKRFEDCVIPVVRATPHLVFWGSGTLCSHKYWKQYPVRRVKDYLDKTLQHYLNKVKGELIEDDNLAALRDRLEAFLGEHVGSGPKRMLDKALVVSVTRGKKPGDIDIVVQLEFKLVSEFLNLKYQFAAQGKTSPTYAQKGGE